VTAGEKQEGRDDSSRNFSDENLPSTNAPTAENHEQMVSSEVAARAEKGPAIAGLPGPTWVGFEAESGGVKKINGLLIFN
jgi:hypothetical protein